MIHLIHETRETALPSAQPDPAALWLNREEILQATGWDWKPEGLCLGDTCVPLPRQREAQMRQGDRLDLAAFWQHTGQPLAHDSRGEHWVLGVGAARRAQALESLQAPDFELPDLEGRIHRLSDHRGRKVFLATWASW